MLARPSDQITVRDVIAASEHTTFDLHCVSNPVGAERCGASHDCSIRPVWMLLQQKIDAVLDSVLLSHLLQDERAVREGMGLPVVSPVQIEGRRGAALGAAVTAPV